MLTILTILTQKKIYSMAYYVYANFDKLRRRKTVAYANLHDLIRNIYVERMARSADREANKKIVNISSC